MWQPKWWTNTTPNHNSNGDWSESKIHRLLSGWLLLTLIRSKSAHAKEVETRWRGRNRNETHVSSGGSENGGPNCCMKELEFIYIELSLFLFLSSWESPFFAVAKWMTRFRFPEGSLTTGESDSEVPTHSAQNLPNARHSAHLRLVHVCVPG